ncbi:hypothetical protein [Congregicoccus parvus]|uniref:hypothetical protein n=1 Tax=Congregicoccus parvus TaxID=3081749 RepID=UPI003FA5BE8A
MRVAGRCWIAVSLLGVCAAIGSTHANGAEEGVVTYEQFGALGDGVADDLPAICAAHEHANARGLPVRSDPEATYHLGRRALTAVIATDTEWGTSRFIIDDSEPVEDHKRSLFEVRSLAKPVSLDLARLGRDQRRLEPWSAGACLVFVENAHERIYVRRGLNQNDGTAQKEVFVVQADGTIEGELDWDYEHLTEAVAYPIDAHVLRVSGGVFFNIANRMRQDVGYNYWARNIRVSRSNTELVGLTHQVTGETEFGHPYSGFLNVNRCANVTLRGCSIAGRKTYRTIGAAGKPVDMGSYGYAANLVVNLRMIGCRMDDIHDRSRWGVIGTNFMKGILVEDCVLSRMDVHMGASGDFVVRRSTLGHAGLNAIGRGRLSVEDSTLHGPSLITFRSDYGSTWTGDVVVRDSRWVVPERVGAVVLFRVDNDGTHDFGYPCAMPQTIRIEGLFIDDSSRSSDAPPPMFFGASLRAAAREGPFPYRVTERIVVSGLETASGRRPTLGGDPELADLIEIVWRAGETATIQSDGERLCRFGWTVGQCAKRYGRTIGLWATKLPPWIEKRPLSDNQTVGRLATKSPRTDCERHSRHRGPRSGHRRSQ